MTKFFLSFAKQKLHLMVETTLKLHWVVETAYEKFNKNLMLICRFFSIFVPQFKKKHQ